MEREEILSTLTGKLGETPFSSRTIGCYIDENPLAEGVEPDDAYWNKAIKFLQSMGGQYRHEVANKYKEIEDTKKPKENPDNGAGKGGDPELLKRIEQLERLNAENAKKATHGALRGEVSEKGKSLKVANEALWQDAVKAVKIGDDDTSDTITEKAKRLYEQQLRRYMGEGATPYGNSGRGGSSKEAEELKKQRREDFKKTMQSRGKLPEKK